jgi:hypothetical protein
MEETINESTSLVNDTIHYSKQVLMKPIIIILLVGLGIYMYLGNISSGIDSSSFTSTSTSDSNFGFVTKLLIIIFIGLIVINGLKYFLNIDIITSVKNTLSGMTEIDVKIDTSRIDAVKSPIPKILLRPQVFNIPENDFVYPDAEAVCKAYGARLATYKEVEEAYEDGADWCNYGWSEGQMALFPTQQKTFDKLQKIEGHEHDCGRPGINGGYIANPALKFGVNCYGYKPRMTSADEELMENREIYPKSLKDQAIDERVNYWKDKLSEILISPFNHKSWSRL